MRAESSGPGDRLLHPGLSSLHAGQSHPEHPGDTGFRSGCGEAPGAESQGEGANGPQHRPSDLLQQRPRRRQRRPPEDGGENILLVYVFLFQRAVHKAIKPESCVSCTQAPEERQRLVKLVQEEPLPADAPPLPEENESDDTAGENDGGEEQFGPILMF